MYTRGYLQYWEDGEIFMPLSSLTWDLAVPKGAFMHTSELHRSDIDFYKSKAIRLNANVNVNVKAWMQTEIDVNHLNRSKFLKANSDRS